MSLRRKYVLSKSRQEENRLLRINEQTLTALELLNGNLIFNTDTGEFERYKRSSRAYRERVYELVAQIDAYERESELGSDYRDFVEQLSRESEPIQEEKEEVGQEFKEIDPDYEIWFPNLVSALFPLAGRTVTLNWNDGEINTTIKVPSRKTDIKRELDQRGFRVESDITYAGNYKQKTGSDPPPVEMSIVSEVEGKGQKQSFRDGIDHCVFEPIKEWALEKKDTAKSASAKRNYNALYNKAVKLEDIYGKGVPQEDIQEICNTLQIGLDITLPLINDNFISCRSLRKPLKVFRFTNTRLNHIERAVGDNKVEILDNYDDLLYKRDELIGNKEYYIFTKGGKNLTSITTLHTKYIVQNEYQEVVSKFEFDNNINSYKLDDINDNDLSFFVKQGTHYNETIDFKAPVGLIRQLDQEKAYFNFWISKYYNGLLGKITDFRKVDKMIKDKKGYIPALYRIYDLDFTECKYNKLLDKLGCYKNYNVYPSCELEFLLDLGITFKINEGCWGVKRVDFRFPEEFKKKENRVSYYARYVGSCDSHRLEKRIWLNGDRDFFENVKSYTKENIFYNEELQEGCVSFKKQNSFHFGHLTSFITSLQRINCIQQMMNFDYDQLIRVCVDGIYFTGEQPELVNLFREKYDHNLRNSAGDCYCSDIYEYDVWDDYLPEYKENIQEQLHLGAGGTGKTHINLTDKGYCKVLYVAPSYKLASKKKEEYDIDSTCWEQLLCKDPIIWSRYIRYYNTILFDEVSMMSKDQLQIIRERFNSCKVILCGDIGFQLPCFSTYKDIKENVEVSDFKNIINYETNYRVKCDKLAGLLSTLRKMMDSWGGDQHLKYIVDNYQERFLSQVDNYNIDDYILTYTNSLKDSYTERFKDTFEEEKYIFKERYGEYCNGSIAILPKDNKVKGKKEIRHAFTIHSIQGETISEDKKLFIDTHLFNSAEDGKLLYTAISRARTLDQIYFVK
jgi:hypothetical protein